MVPSHSAPPPPRNNLPTHPELAQYQLLLAGVGLAVPVVPGASGKAFPRPYSYSEGALQHQCLWYACISGAAESGLNPKFSAQSVYVFTFGYVLL